MTLPSQRDRFDIPTDIAYLNCAYMGPLSRSVVAAGEAGVRRKSLPWTITSADFFTQSENVRGLASRLYQSTTDDIAFVPSVSYGTAVAAQNLTVARGQEILCLGEQFPSHVYIWKRLATETGGRVVMIDRSEAATSNGGTDWTGALVDRISEQTAIVAVPHCHWTDGSQIDLVLVGKTARENGAALVLDLTQSLSAKPFSVLDVDPDFAVAGSYKWQLGPYTLGTLYVAPRHHDGRPLEENWIARAGSEDFSGLVDYRSDYQPGARRYDMGERTNVHLMPMLEAALEQTLDWGVDDIAATLSAMTASIAERAMVELGLTSVPPPHRAGHFLGLNFPDGLPDRLVEDLKARNVFVSVRGTSMRVTPHVYNTADDIDRLFDALHAVTGRQAA